MASPDTHSVTRLIHAVQEDRASAVGPLLAVYFDRLVQLARRRLQDLPGMANYDEDLALRSFYSVYRRLRDTDRPLQLSGRDDLWRLLAARTILRAIDMLRRHRPVMPISPASFGCARRQTPLPQTRHKERADPA